VVAEPEPEWVQLLERFGWQAVGRGGE
jgi:hypothetical protein